MSAPITLQHKLTLGLALVSDVLEEDRTCCHIFCCFAFRNQQALRQLPDLVMTRYSRLRAQFKLVKLGNVNVTFLDHTNLLGYDGQDFAQVRKSIQ